MVRRQYPLRTEDRKRIKPIINKFLTLELLKECESKFNTSIPVKKPNETYGLVQDVQAVNGISKSIHPVLANLYTLLTKLCNDLIWFSVIHLKCAFFCLPLAEESKNIHTCFDFLERNLEQAGKTNLSGQCYLRGSKTVKQSHNFWESIGQRTGTMAVSSWGRNTPTMCRLSSNCYKNYQRVPYIDNKSAEFSWSKCWSSVSTESSAGATTGDLS